MIIALYSVAAVCSLLAWYLRGRQREYLPVALFFSIWLGVDAVREAYNVVVLERLWPIVRANPELTGTPLFAAAVYGYYGIKLIPAAALVGASLVVFAKRSPWLAGVGWALTLGAFMVIHPRAADGSQRLAESIVDAAASSISALLFFSLYFRERGSTFAFVTWFFVVLYTLGWAIASFWAEPPPIVFDVFACGIAVASLFVTFFGTKPGRMFESRPLVLDMLVVGLIGLLTLTVLGGGLVLAVRWLRAWAA